MDTNVTTLVIGLALLFGAIVVWAGWRLIYLDRKRTAHREVGESPADTQRTKLTKRAKRAQPLRLRICEGQIHGRKSPHAVVAGPGIDPLRAGLRRPQTL